MLDRTGSIFKSRGGGEDGKFGTQMDRCRTGSSVKYIKSRSGIYDSDADDKGPATRRQ